MNDDNEQVVKWMKALIDSVADLSALAREFRALPDVEKVYNDLTVGRMRNPFGVEQIYYGFEYYFDVFLRNDNAICWHMDVSWDEEQWVIESHVSIPGRYGSETIKQFPDRFASSVDQFVVELSAATKQLVKCSDLMASQRSKSF
jgi:hypothetical protein